jgi:hypothetical protein
MSDSLWISGLWDALHRIKLLRFAAGNGPGSATNWRGHAEGTVETVTGSNTIDFLENVVFQSDEGSTLRLRNRYRWRREMDCIHLSHLRHGDPVHLATIVPFSDSAFAEEAPHLCGADCYRISLTLLPDGIDAIWRISGPKKNERILYHYR